MSARSRIRLTPGPNYRGLVRRPWLSIDTLVDTAAPCVEALGHPVEPSPTFEVWYAAHKAEQPHWHPFDAIAQDHEALNDAYGHCPPDAPDLYPPDLKG